MTCLDNHIKKNKKKTIEKTQIYVGEKFTPICWMDIYVYMILECETCANIQNKTETFFLIIFVK